MVVENKKQRALEMVLNLSDNSNPTDPTDPTDPETLNSFQRNKMYKENANNN